MEPSSSNDLLNCSTGLGLNKIPSPKGKDGVSDKMTLKCTFGRRTFTVKLNNPRGALASVADLTDAIAKETNIPHEKQRLLVKGKGIYMDPPDITGFSTLEDLCFKSGDQVLVINSRRVATDDEETQIFDEILPLVKVTDRELSDLFYDVDKTERGWIKCGRQTSVLNALRSRAISVEDKYMALIKTASDLDFHHGNAVYQARRREMIDNCQRQIDKTGELASAIYDRLALINRSTAGGSVYPIPRKGGPCPHEN